MPVGVVDVVAVMALVECGQVPLTRRPGLLGLVPQAWQARKTGAGAQSG